MSSDWFLAGSDLFQDILRNHFVLPVKPVPRVQEHRFCQTGRQVSAERFPVPFPAKRQNIQAPEFHQFRQDGLCSRGRPAGKPLTQVKLEIDAPRRRQQRQQFHAGQQRFRHSAEDKGKNVGSERVSDDYQFLLVPEIKIVLGQARKISSGFLRSAARPEIAQGIETQHRDAVIGQDLSEASVRGLPASVTCIEDCHCVRLLMARLNFDDSRNPKPAQEDDCEKTEHSGQDIPSPKKIKGCPGVCKRALTIYD
jgi:hypothetical protein